MENKFSQFIVELTSIAPRRGKGEQKAYRVIRKYLDAEQIKYHLQKFQTKIPVTLKAELIADNYKVPCVGSSFTSGNFDNDTSLLSSYGAKSDKPAIIFNPVSKGICLQSYNQFPSISVNRDEIVHLVMAEKISGEVEVGEEEFLSTNILVGNIDNPKKIIFAHYDSIVGSGAVDNAGSVDVVFQTFLENKQLMENNLFVFAGSEEETISNPNGFHGFEMFDRKYKKLIDHAQEIIVLDGIGVGKASIVRSHIDWVFGINRINNISEKVAWIQNDQTLVMQYYHTAMDTLDKLDQKYLEDTKEFLIKILIS